MVGSVDECLSGSGSGSAWVDVSVGRWVYDGRSASVCERWVDFASFLALACVVRVGRWV